MLGLEPRRHLAPALHRPLLDAPPAARVQSHQGPSRQEALPGEKRLGEGAVLGGERVDRPGRRGEPVATATARRFCSTHDTVSSSGTTSVSR